MKTISRKSVYALLLLSFFIIVYILPLGSRDLLTPDETRYAEIPREMITSGDWVVPHLNGVRYFEKPALGYWMHALSILLFGENNFAVRLPSVMAAGFSALLVYILMRRVIHDNDNQNASSAILAPLIFLTCFEVFGVGNTAVLDSLFAFFLTATITSFFFATETDPWSLREQFFLLLAGVSCGIAFLTKGFLAFALPVLTVVPYLIWRRRYYDLLRMAWLPIVTAVIIALSWSLLIHLREPDFWRFFFWNEHIRRFIAGSAQHQESFWYFFLISPAMVLPWTFLIPSGIQGIKSMVNGRNIQGRLIRFSICWLSIPFLFFSVSDGKLLTYILPCFPPFAILMAFGLLNAIKMGQKKIFQWGVALTCILFGAILLALMYVQLFGYEGFHPYSRPWRVIMAANGFIFILLFCIWSFKSHGSTRKIILFGLSPFLLFLVSHYIIPDLTIEKKAPGVLLQRHIHDIDNNTIILSDENTVRAVCWYLHRNDVYLIEDGGELDYGLEYGDASGRLLDIKSAADLIMSERTHVLLIARMKNISRWRDQLPRPIFQDDNGPDGYVLWKY